MKNERQLERVSPQSRRGQTNRIEPIWISKRLFHKITHSKDALSADSLDGWEHDNRPEHYNNRASNRRGASTSIDFT